MAEKKTKNYVLDTNILIHCPDSIFKFDDNNVYVTHTTMEELDGLKSAQGEVGYNAREAIRLINGLRSKGKLINGVETQNGGKFFVCAASTSGKLNLPAGWKTEKSDNQILSAVLDLMSKLENVILVSNDVSMVLKADMLEIKAESYRNDRVSQKEELYTGRTEIRVRYHDIELFDELERLQIDDLAISMMNDGDAKGEKCPFNTIEEYVKHFNLVNRQFVTLFDDEGNKRLGIYENEAIHKLKSQRQKPFNVTPRNSGQFFAQEALMAPADEVPLVILKGEAGTSKTFYSLACGLEQVVNQQRYKRILICRPNVKFDEDIGYLKGTEMDKIMPLIRPCLDNLEVLININDKKNGMPKKTALELECEIQSYFDCGWLSAEALAYLRGRSISDTFIIIDEAQNASPNQILGIITRAGEGSKICIIGDINQIDNPRLDKYNNGLAFASERMKGSDVCMQMTFTDEECTRSKLARVAAELLS